YLLCNGDLSGFRRSRSWSRGLVVLGDQRQQRGLWRQHHLDTTVERAPFLVLVGGTRHVGADAADAQTVMLQAAEAEDRRHRARTLATDGLIDLDGASTVGMAEHDHC